MEEKIGLIGIICVPNHAQTLNEWAKERALTTEVYSENDLNIRACMKELEQLAANVIVVDDQAIGGVNGENELLNYIPKHENTKFIFVASPQRYKEAYFIGQLSDVGLFSILLPRYYAEKREECKQQFLRLIEGTASKANNEALFATYPSKPKKKLFRKSAESVVDDVLFSEIKSVFDVPDDEKVDEVDYFKSIRKEKKSEQEKNRAKITEEKQEFENKLNVKQQEEIVEEKKLSAVTEPITNQDVGYESMTEEDKQLEAIMSSMKMGPIEQEVMKQVSDQLVEQSSSGQSVNCIEQTPSSFQSNDIKQDNNDNNVNLSIDGADLQEMIHKIISDEVNMALKKMKIDLAIDMKKMNPSKPQRTIYVTETAERMGAVRWALTFAFAYAILEPELKVATFFNDDEGAEVLLILNGNDPTKKTTEYKNVHIEQIDNLDDFVLSDYDVRIVVLKDVEKLHDIKKIYDEFYVIVGGEPWEASKMIQPITQFIDEGLCENVTFAKGPTASKEGFDIIKEITQGIDGIKFCNHSVNEANFFAKNFKPNSQWNELVWKYQPEKLKKLSVGKDKKEWESGSKPKLEKSKKDQKKPNWQPGDPVTGTGVGKMPSVGDVKKEVKETKQPKENTQVTQNKKKNVFQKYMSWTKEDWEKPENKQIFDWFLGKLPADAFSVGEENANGKTHEGDFKSVRNKIYQYFPEERPNQAKKLHDDAKNNAVLDVKSQTVEAEAVADSTVGE